MDPEKAADWAEILKAVAHPTRLMILSDLVKGMKCVGEIRELVSGEEREVPQPNISQHLAVLKHSGLVASLRDGAFRCYYLPRPELVGALFDLFDGEYPIVGRPERGAFRVRGEGARPARGRSRRPGGGRAG